MEYCENLLKNREPKQGFEDDLKWKRAVHNVRIKESIENDVEFSVEMYKNSLKELKRTKSNKYKFIVNGGPSMHAALKKLYKIVWEEERKPDKWKDSILYN